MRKQNLVDIQTGKGRTLKIYFRGLLHLSILVEVVAIQSWYSGWWWWKRYSIEYSTRAGEVLTEYTDKALWSDLLKLLDKLDW